MALRVDDSLTESLSTKNLYHENFCISKSLPSQLSANLSLEMTTNDLNTIPVISNGVAASGCAIKNSSDVLDIENSQKCSETDCSVFNGFSIQSSISDFPQPVCLTHSSVLSYDTRLQETHFSQEYDEKSRVPDPSSFLLPIEAPISPGNVCITCNDAPTLVNGRNKSVSEVDSKSGFIKVLTSSLSDSDKPMGVETIIEGFSILAFGTKHELMVSILVWF
ncbi:unnamed protein product [Protopolystoma xenopodis]|uniref:Uncharacterized protein n=1 Tax=Protopolystoma xenopodis TaxID=117903 RepID=A0A3S5A592_9PLAT|nr:unnamed protein product [Protopolystoma xenopodis]